MVIGASIAGPAVCYWLKKFGFSPTLIERNDILSKGGYAIDVRGIAIDVVKRMGIYEKICDMRTQLETGYYVDANGNIVLKEQGEKFGFRQGEEVEIVRGDLVEILMQSIKDIPCYFSQAIDRIEQYDETVKVTFKNGRTENYDLIIGADGVHSSTRGIIFADDEYDLIDLGYYISVFSIPNYLNLNRSGIYFELNQKSIHIASDKNLNVAFAGFMFRSSQKLDNIRNEKEQKSLLKNTFLNLGWESNKLLELMDDSNDFYFDAIMQVKMKSWTKGRVVLVGDSGYCASPLSGQGTSLALAGAYILAGELKASGGNYSTAFKQYNTLMRPYVEANQGFGAWVSETFLLSGELSKYEVESRADNVLERLQTASNSIELPEY